MPCISSNAPRYLALVTQESGQEKGTCLPSALQGVSAGHVSQEIGAAAPPNHCYSGAANRPREPAMSDDKDLHAAIDRLHHNLELPAIFARRIQVNAFRQTMTLQFGMPR